MTQILAWSVLTRVQYYWMSQAKLAKRDGGSGSGGAKECT